MPIYSLIPIFFITTMSLLADIINYHWSLLILLVQGLQWCLFPTEYVHSLLIENVTSKTQAVKIDNFIHFPLAWTFRNWQLYPWLHISLINMALTTPVNNNLSWVFHSKLLDGSYLAWRWAVTLCCCNDPVRPWGSRGDNHNLSIFHSSFQTCQKISQHFYNNTSTVIVTIIITSQI